MVQIPLLSGAYQTRSIIAGAQRCVNLFGEVEHFETFAYFPQPTGPSVTTHYPTPGLTSLATPTSGALRGLYFASTDQLFAVVGTEVVYLSSTFGAQSLGSIAKGTSICSMADDGSTLVLVDGTSAGYTIDLATLAFSTISDPTGTFVGADFVRYLNTYFIFNKPGTPQFYSTESGSLTFNALYFANKSGYADPLAAIAVAQQQIWLIGTQTSEVWYDSGGSLSVSGAQFPFSQVEGAFINHGCVAPYSVAVYDSNVFWLSRDNAGQAIVVMGQGNYQAQRISTHAIEYQIQQYASISDAVGYVYQNQGHVFYVLSFPCGDATWVYDMASKLWHEWSSADVNGFLHRHRCALGCYAYGQIVGGDYETGQIYKIDPKAYTDNGTPIQRIRSFPHMVADLKRVRFNRFVADIAVGTGNPAADTTTGAAPYIYLRVSRDRGASFGTPLQQTLGSEGDFRKLVQWRRLGVARDAVFEVFWSAPVETALNGAFIDAEPLAS